MSELQLVSYKDIAKRLGIDPGTVRRLIERHGADLGVTVERGRGNSSNAKWAHYLSREDAERLATFYLAKHAAGAEPSAEDAFQAFGYFYLIQLVPEAIPNRIKIGYTDQLEKRLAEHQTAAPTARVIGSWPCKRSRDYAAMDSITRVGCVWVMNEVFEGEPEGFIQRANAFFAVMPIADARRPLSEHSPLRKVTETANYIDESAPTPAR
jgi:T5orf172 domain